MAENGPKGCPSKNLHLTQTTLLILLFISSVQSTRKGKALGIKSDRDFFFSLTILDLKYHPFIIVMIINRSTIKTTSLTAQLMILRPAYVLADDIFTTP